jgi:hypothetical protein
MIAAAPTVTTTVETAASTITAAMEAPTAAAVETSAATAATMTTAMLGERRNSQANEREGSETCEKSLEQGGFPHMNTPPPKRRLDAREGTLRLNSSYLYLEPHSKLEVVYSLPKARLRSLLRWSHEQSGQLGTCLALPEVDCEAAPTCGASTTV